MDGMPILNKDMSVCISLAGRPSNLGTRFHNFLYDELGLNFIYKAFTTDDIEGAVRGIRALGIRGCSVSMPFKEAVIPLVDVMEDSAAAIESVNTIVNDDGVLTASNTDYEAIAMLIAEHALDPDQRVLVRGSGGMAKAVVAAFRGAGFDDLTRGRAQRRGRPRAGRRSTGTHWVAEDPEPDFDLIVNVTPLGMHGADAAALAFPPAFIERATTVFDVVAFPAETPLVVAARAAGKLVISGAEVIALQAARQFERYTGVLAHARAGRAGVGVLAGRVRSAPGRERAARRASVHERAQPDHEQPEARGHQRADEAPVPGAPAPGRGESAEHGEHERRRPRAPVVGDVLVERRPTTASSRKIVGSTIAASSPIVCRIDRAPRPGWRGSRGWLGVLAGDRARVDVRQPEHADRSEREEQHLEVGVVLPAHGDDRAHEHRAVDRVLGLVRPRAPSAPASTRCPYGSPRPRCMGSWVRGLYSGATGERRTRPAGRLAGSGIRLAASARRCSLELATRDH